MTASAASPTRHERIDAGIDLLLQTLEDLLRRGLARADDDALAGLQRRLVDAQAPGLAARIGRIALEPDAERRVFGLGRLCLLCDAWKGRDGLPAPLRDDVRALVGIPTMKDAVERHGDTVADEWLVLGAVSELDATRDLRTTRTWLRGRRGGRSAIVLAFAAGMNSRRRAGARSRSPPPGSASGEAPAATVLEPGSAFEGVLAFWPGELGERAMVLERADEVHELGPSRLPGRGGVRDVLDGYAALLARQPFAARMLVVLGDVRIAPSPEDIQRGWVVDGEDALPLASAQALTLLAVSGGHAAELVAEWDGDTLLPLGIGTREGYVALDPEAIAPSASLAEPPAGVLDPIARAALVGVAPTPPPPSGSGLDDVLPAAPSELTLLRRAGLAELARRAGRLPDEAPRLPEPAPPDARPLVPARIAAFIGFLLRPGTPRALIDLHEEMLPLLAARDLRLPSHLLASILQHPRIRHHPALAALAGPRGVWLARWLRPPPRPPAAKKPPPRAPVAAAQAPSALDWRPGAQATTAHVRALGELARPLSREVSAFFIAWLDRFPDAITLAAHPLGDAMVAIALGLDPRFLPALTARVPALYKNFKDALVIAETRRRFHEELARAPDPSAAAAG